MHWRRGTVSSADSDDASEALERRLGHTFTDTALRTRALTHRSHGNEASGDPSGHNERLEFLGDAVLGFVMSRILYETYPGKTEGELTRLRSALVSDARLSDKARELGLGRHLRLGRGEERSGGRDKDSILADAYESLVAAIFLDGGLNAAEQFVKAEYTDEVQALGEAVSGLDGAR